MSITGAEDSAIGCGRVAVSSGPDSFPAVRLVKLPHNARAALTPQSKRAHGINPRK